MWGLSASIGDSPIGRPSYGGETGKLVGNHLISPESSRPHPYRTLREHRSRPMAIKITRHDAGWAMIANQPVRSQRIATSIPRPERADAA